jgi:transcriptional regulator with XRE-family HTH domain
MTAGIIAASLGELLRRYKTRERITSAEMARRLGVTKSAADRLLQDRMPDPGITLAEQIATLIHEDLTTVAAAARVSQQLQQKERELAEAS